MCMVFLRHKNVETLKHSEALRFVCIGHLNSPLAPSSRRQWKNEEKMERKNTSNLLTLADVLPIMSRPGIPFTLPACGMVDPGVFGEACGSRHQIL